MIALDPYSSVISEDVDEILKANLPWRELRGKTVAITGAAGMLAAYVVETLLARAETKVVALVRNVEKAKARFLKYLDSPQLEIVQYDCKSPLRYAGSVNYIIHAASLPRPDIMIPVDVIVPNMLGTYYLLEYARQQVGFEKFIYFSSGAVYGEMKGSGVITEEMGFSVMPHKVENCYSIGKMSGEALCAAYCRQYGIQTHMLRYAHTFGPGMDLQHDIRAFAEFMRNALQGKDISLQTTGGQRRCYCYITDATVALFRVLFNGSPGEAYNIVNEDQTYSIREFAEIVTQVSQSGIRVALREGSQENRGYSPQCQPAMMSSARLRELSWQPTVDVKLGLYRTLSSYRND